MSLHFMDILPVKVESTRIETNTSCPKVRRDHLPAPQHFTMECWSASMWNLSMYSSQLFCYSGVTTNLGMRNMNGAGGTSGGTGQFILGLLMMCGGFYMLLSGIVVSSSFGMSTRLFGLGSSFGITSGMILIPMMIGIGMVFYNGRSYLGWALFVGSLAALIMGVIASVNLNLRTMSAFELIVILVLAIGGLGLFLRSLKPSRPRLPPPA